MGKQKKIQFVRPRLQDETLGLDKDRARDITNRIIAVQTEIAEWRTTVTPPVDWRSSMQSGFWSAAGATVYGGLVTVAAEAIGFP